MSCPNHPKGLHDYGVDCAVGHEFSQVMAELTTAIDDVEESLVGAKLLLEYSLQAAGFRTTVLQSTGPAQAAPTMT